jgi:hypothetical protein
MIKNLSDWQRPPPLATVKLATFEAALCPPIYFVEGDARPQPDLLPQEKE